MNLTHEGLTLWYGTPDAPAPFDDATLPRAGVSLVVGVHPANPTNVVRVHYRVDGKQVLVLPGREVRIDYERSIQYFSVTFPRFVEGSLVEYAPVFACGGRQVPAPERELRFSSHFHLESKQGAPRVPAAR